MIEKEEIPSFEFSGTKHSTPYKKSRNAVHEVRES